jgi:hypothetical protein
MATSTLIQFLASGEASDTSHRRQVETFIAGGTIAALDVVGSDTSKTGADKALYVIQAANVATGNPLAVGVALNGAAAGEAVRVVVAGYVADVNCAGGTIGAAGLPLSAGKTAAGEVDASAASDTAGCFAVSLEAKGATTANKVAIMVKKQF